MLKNEILSHDSKGTVSMSMEDKEKTAVKWMFRISHKVM